MSVSKQAKRRGTILDEMMAHHRERLPKVMREVPLENVRAFARIASPPRDFLAALKAPGVSLIAECKKASPSRGLIVPDYHPVELARVYQRAGARAISVLTDARHFQGSLTDLRDVRQAVRVPVLRKDFTFHPYQVYESRAAGADAILLIAAVLPPVELDALATLAGELGMSALVEVHDEEELAEVLPLKPRLVGINNRDLQTFEVDLETTARLKKLIPPDIVTVGESGIKTAGDVRRMAEIGVDAILVGESLARSKDVYAATSILVSAGR